MSTCASGIGNKWFVVLSLSCRSYSSSSCGLQITVFDVVFHVLACFFVIVWFDVKTLSEVCWCKTYFSLKVRLIFSLSTYFHIFLS